MCLLPPSSLLHPPQTLPALVYLVQNDDMAVKVDACWALSFLADGQEKQIQVSTSNTHINPGMSVSSRPSLSLLISTRSSWLYIHVGGC